MFRVLKRNVDVLIREISEIAYYMKGGISYEDLMYRTPGEKQIMADVIEKNLKIEFQAKGLSVG